MNAPASLKMRVNGTAIHARVDVRTTLADFIRDGCGLVGTKIGCEHGVCGSCTVLVDDLPVRSCLMLAVSAHGSSVRTVESLAGDGLSDLQTSFRDNHALQCGFCTPGLLMTAQALLESPADEEIDVREAVSGHICRCTGYEPIITAIEAAVRLRRPSQ
jgi:carbon-monoxide dehydrogenase small subunit